MPDKQNPNQRLCGRPGHPYCAEHQLELDYIHSVNQDFEEIERTHKAVCEEPTEEEQQFCVACNCHPVHDSCIYCENCCGDDPLDFLGPQA